MSSLTRNDKDLLLGRLSNTYRHIEAIRRTLDSIVADLRHVEKQIADSMKDKATNESR